mmetsp:Transcript_2013/g.5683  ORF Transcript_2013/g.5683 Transcript_2013/m.5683 type:complete len:635 (+) Transcript_2013:74-1978(+)
MAPSCLRLLRSRDGARAPPRHIAWAITLATTAACASAAVDFSEIGGQPDVPVVTHDSSQPDCVWPTCASRCPACDRTSPNATQCVVTLPFIAACPVSQKCWLGRCTCYDGFCAKDGGCVARECTEGAKPEPFLPGVWVERWNMFSLPGPSAEHSSFHAWLFYWFVAWLVPGLIVMLGLAVSGGTMRMLAAGPDVWPCRRVPRVPIFVPIWATLTLVICCNGFAQRSRFVSNTSYVAREQLHSIKADLELVLSYGEMLEQTATEFRDAVHAIPESCHRKDLTEPIMSKIVGAVDKATTGTIANVDRLYQALQLLPGRIRLALFCQYLSDIILVWFPIVPAIFEVAAMIFVVFISCLAFKSPDPRIAERAVRGMKRYGSWCFSVLITITTFLGALYLHTALMSSRFCSNVDANVMGYADNFDFARAIAGHNSTQAEKDFREFIFYYVGGLGFNPLEQIAATIQSNVRSLDVVRNSTRGMQDIATLACPAVATIEAEEIKRQMDDGIARIMELLDPENVWPFYHTVVHQVYCTELPTRIASLIGYSLLLGLVMLPVLAMSLDVDLKRMVTYKGTHIAFGAEDEEDEEEEEDELSDEEDFDDPGPAKSSMTYTHISPTVARVCRKKSGADHPMRTFLA